MINIIYAGPLFVKKKKLNLRKSSNFKFCYLKSVFSTHVMAKIAFLYANY